MATAKKKEQGKKKRHMKTTKIGVTTSVQFRKDVVVVTTRIPKARLTERLLKQLKAGT